MLRCVELVNLKVEDVTLIYSDKWVVLNIQESKMDQTLKCCGMVSCSRLGPWSLAMRVLVDHVSGEGNPFVPGRQRHGGPEGEGHQGMDGCDRPGDDRTFGTKKRGNVVR